VGELHRHISFLLFSFSTFPLDSTFPLFYYSTIVKSIKVSDEVYWDLKRISVDRQVGVGEAVGLALRCLQGLEKVGSSRAEKNRIEPSARDEEVRRGEQAVQDAGSPLTNVGGGKASVLLALKRATGAVTGAELGTGVKPTNRVEKAAFTPDRQERVQRDEVEGETDPPVKPDPIIEPEEGFKARKSVLKGMGSPAHEEQRSRRGF
jgi:hypothetical protein